MRKEILQQLIQKYLNGDCTPKETTIVHEWYSLFEQEEDPMDILSLEQQEELKRRLLNGIRTNIAFQDTESRQLNLEKNQSRTLIYSLSGIAAALILVLGISFFNRNTTIIPVQGDVMVTNRTKSIQKLALTDGSIVWLNPNSKVKYPRRFTAGKREVQMYGEAFFEVTKDPKRPFIIYSGDVITKVLGTSFRVRAYSNVPVEVSVITGKVSVQLVQQKEAEIMLLPNQKVTYLKNANSLTKDLEKKTSVMRIWQKTTLSFDNELIGEVIKVLNKKFGVYISSGDEKLLRYSLKADFTDQNLPAILEMLKKSLDIGYEINDRKIILNTQNK